ncbi:MAG: mycothiol synthase [Microbacteriaceae bacterium]
MSSSLRLSVPDITDPNQAAAFFRIADAARGADGYDPFNEQTRIDLDAGRRRPLLAHAANSDTALAAAAVGSGQLALVVHPDHRGARVGTAVLEEILAGHGGAGELLAWSHGDHPAARALGASHHFEPVRTLLQLRLAPLPEFDADAAQAAGPAQIAIESFRPGADEEEWVALNARIFSAHPEQGKLTVEDLRARQREPWFDADDFLVARDATGQMVGYNWLKIDDEADLAAGSADARSGEIYVIGVEAASAGHGLGRALMHAGLNRMRDRRCAEVTLYVESDNTAAVRLYRSLGFADHTIDVQYRRPPR